MTTAPDKPTTYWPDEVATPGTPEHHHAEMLHDRLGLGQVSAETAPSAMWPEDLPGTPVGVPEEILDATDPPETPAPGTAVAVNPATGEAVDLTGSALTLDDALVSLTKLTDALAEYRASIEEELVRRADATGDRTVVIDGLQYKVNEPTEEAYDVGEVSAALRAFMVGEKPIVSRALFDSIIVRPKTPPPPPQQVAKRKMNTLKKSGDPALRAALSECTRIVKKKRTVKIIGRPVEATATEIVAPEPS
jgi:hypothetical protein